ncbi:MAG: VTT domain-containing protein [Henriciella sp.]|nr:VTT domain-containing protein [Henriciella sp.]
MSAAEPASLIQRVEALAHSRWLLPVLLVIEIAETTFVPLPYEALFIALCAAARDRIWVFVAVTMLGSAIGGSILYLLGMSFAESIAAMFGAEAALVELTAVFAERGASFIMLGGTTPAPSYLINLAAGASGYPYLAFLSLFSASRFIRFALLGLLIYYFGDEIAGFWKRLPKWLRWVLSLLIAAALVYWFVSGFV